MIDEKKLAELNGEQSLCNACQLFDGWHSDVAWTEWDQSVRADLSKLLAAWPEIASALSALWKVARAAELFNEREPKIAEICGIAQALAALHAPTEEKRRPNG